MPTQLPPASPLAAHWRLDPNVVFLNHGSFGAAPIVVQAAQQRLRERMEAEPVRFLIRELEPLLDASRAAVASFIGASPEDLVFVANATTGVNAVVRSQRFGPGDELLCTDHGYNACANVLRFVAERDGARVVVAPVPFPIQDPDEVVQAVLGAVTPRTRFAIIDHITSPTALVFPVEKLVPALQAKGVKVLVDGAHAPGMVPLDLRALSADYYVGNCHKWVCAPKGVGVLIVKRELQGALRPGTISHGANSPRTDRSRYQLEFDWVGTGDPTAALCVPEALAFMGKLRPGGWPQVMQENHRLAVAGRTLLLNALGQEPPAPEVMLGSMASVLIPDGVNQRPRSSLYSDASQDALLYDHRVEVPVASWPAPPKRLLRIATQQYNSLAQVEYLAGLLPKVFG